MKPHLLLSAVLALWGGSALAAQIAKVTETDVCVYGGTSGGVAAAVQAARMGKSVVIAEPDRHLGGMTAGGLSAVDIGDPRSVGGIAREYFTRLAATVGAKLAWDKPFVSRGGGPATGGAYAIEPHKAEQVFDDMVREAGVKLHFQARLASVKKEGARITGFTTEDGTVFRAKMFIDATYEGDLMARAGVSYTLMRDGNAKYGETFNGIHYADKYLPRTNHLKPGPSGRVPGGQGVWDRDFPLDPYVIKGDPKSGLLPLIQQGDPGTPGDPAPGLQAYCYRLCLTTDPANRLPIAPPPDYDAKRYEIVARFIEACRANGDDMDLRWFSKHDPLPNDKWDFNTATFGGNLPGASWEWPDAGYARRDQIAKAHENYHRGLLHFLATDPRVPLKVRGDMRRYGLPRDEFTDNSGWPHQLYIREARRMVSDFVMTEHHTFGRQVAPHSVGLGSYGTDTHEIRRIVRNGVVTREGKTATGRDGAPPYPIGFGAIVPKQAECDNLFVTFALSASHTAFSSIRMEPVFMVLGQSAATAACIAIEDDVPVQKVNYARLRSRLLGDKQVLEWKPEPKLVAARVRAAEPQLLVLKPGVTVRGEQPQAWLLDLTALDAASAVEAARKLGTRLYGASEPKLHAPLVIKTRFDRERVFGFKVNAVSVSGGTLTVTMNGKVVFSKVWPAAKATHQVGTLWQFPLPAGPAEIALEASRGVVVMDAYYVADAADLLPAGAEIAVVDLPPAAPTKGVAQPLPPVLSGTVDGYRGIWFTLGQFSQHGDKYSGGLGTYTSSHNPLAVYSAKADKTFFTYGGTIKGQRHLLIMASYFDHKTGRVPRPVIVHDKQSVDDPHDNGSLQLDDQGYVWIFVSGRGRKRPGFKYRSRKPFSVAQFDRISEEEMTYPQPWFIAGHGWLHLFTKYTGGRELYWETSSDGRQWSDDHKLAGMGGHYQVSGLREGTVASFFNYHPGGNVDKRTNLYYVQTEDYGRTWTTIDGQPLELPLSALNNPALVVNYAAQGKNMYACDLNFDRAGRPLLLHVTSRGYAPGPENDPREFCLTRWDGRAWQTGTITRTDHNYDMGSLWVSGDDWKVIAPTLPGPQPYGGGGEMCLWSSSDQGRTWTLQKQITRSSPLNHNYARRPRNAHDPFFAFWADGDPNSFSESRLYFCDSAGGHVWQLPFDMESESATPMEVHR